MTNTRDKGIYAVIAFGSQSPKLRRVGVARTNADGETILTFDCWPANCREFRIGLPTGSGDKDSTRD